MEEKKGAAAAGKHLPISEWDKEDRPREKMVLNGKKSLSNSELLAILLRTGVKGTSALAMAQQLLQRTDGRLSGLARMEVTDLQSIGGLGMAKATAVMAALELGNRMLDENEADKSEYVRNVRELFKTISHKIIDLPHEEFWMVLTSARNRVIWKQCIGSGGITQTTVDLRLMFRAAVEHGAVAMGVAHNHPSGDLTPSKSDKDLTQRITNACNTLGIKFLDHLIIGITPEGKREYYSFYESQTL